MLPKSSKASSALIRAIFSEGRVRSWPPAESSVVSQSENAVESHASCASPERVVKPSTATERRGLNTPGFPLIVAGWRNQIATRTTADTSSHASAKPHISHYLYV